VADRETRLLADCLRAVDARRARSEAAHAAALQDEAACASGAAEADRALADAADAWTRQVDGRFDPALGALLGRELLARAARSETAGDDHRAATATRERSAAGWQAENARRRALEEEAAAALRRAARRADERRLAALADRETLARSSR